MKKATLLFAIILAMPCGALLPPLYDSLAEFKSLINDERLPQALDSGEAIVDIKKVDETLVVTTNRRSITVKVVGEPTHLIGPRKYHLEFPN